ncbi:DUF1824 family protein [Dactylococcopsis salina]|uniref:DUF1824 domain-containing protein n=1 Tax=Dactylococcopsis salina (strain PCC 8305) TaxID=13035 RepID=K9YXY6_DACS8|nr:DUF1824 family protein [Dactylococcopsis salina]AFZ50978.1 protein of unknown function (DUF1824) [Dactylococcopsis salina PCC 8305]
MEITQARKLLDQFSCTEQKSVETQEQKQELQTAIQDIVKESEWENLGVCAENTQQAIIALKTYLMAFGYVLNQVDFNQVDQLKTPVYIKFSTKQMGFYQDNYTGDYRGVLVSCQAEDDLIAGVYGHLPLDLFEEK